MLCGWEGNRRSGVSPAMRHRLRGLSTYGLNGLCVGDEHLAYAFGARHHLYLYYKSTETPSVSVLKCGIQREFLIVHTLIVQVPVPITR